MASRTESIVANPSWNTAQKSFFNRLRDALPIVMSYLTDEIPVMDNHTTKMLVDETGVLKQIKKPVETAEKAHVTRMKAVMDSTPELKDEAFGDAFRAYYQGSERVILNQEACKVFIEKANELEIHLGRLLAAIESKQLNIPNNVFLRPETEREDGTVQPPEFNNPDFFTTAAGGRSLYVKPIGG